jgi:hypothetical protein
MEHDKTPARQDSPVPPGLSAAEWHVRVDLAACYRLRVLSAKS